MLSHSPGLVASPSRPDVPGVLKVGIASGDWVHPSRTPENVERWGGSGWARIGQYIEHLPFDIVHGVLTWVRDHLGIMDTSGELHDVDVILMQRLMYDGISDHMIASQKQGIKIINDIDDWYWGLSPTNDAFRHNHPKVNPRANFNHYRKIIANSDLIISSTPYLAGRVAEFCRAPIEVSKNTVDISRFTPREHHDTPHPIVGWVGSTNHRSGDLEILKGIFPAFLRTNSIRLFHGGTVPKAPSFASRVGVLDGEVETMPLCPHSEYPNLMVMDIGLVPLTKMPFNRCKSDIKGLEYAAAGVPFIASTLDAYIELQQDLGIGRLAKNPVQWSRHIKELSHYETRKEEAERNREMVKSRDISTGVSRLADLISNA